MILFAAHTHTHTHVTPSTTVTERFPVCFLLVITAPELHTQWAHLFSVLSLSFSPTPFVPLPPPRVMYTYTCQIYSPLAPFVPFSIHKGLSTRVCTRKAGCIEEGARKRMRIANPEREGYRQREKERQGLSILRESPTDERGKRRLRRPEGDDGAGTKRKERDAFAHCGNL